MVKAGSLRLALDADRQASSVHPLGRELLLGVVNGWEYTAKNGRGRVNDLRPLHNSFGSSVQDTLQKLSSLRDGVVIMESPHVPCTLVSG